MLATIKGYFDNGQIFLQEKAPVDTKTEVMVVFMSNEKQPDSIRQNELSDRELTKVAMSISEYSLQQDWGTEDEANWEKFLKD